jgi:hypothetical protein
VTEAVEEVGVIVTLDEETVDEGMEVVVEWVEVVMGEVVRVRVRMRVTELDEDGVVGDDIDDDVVEEATLVVTGCGNDGLL